MTPPTMCAALLHDTVEDTAYTLEAAARGVRRRDRRAGRRRHQARQGQVRRVGAGRDRAQDGRRDGPRHPGAGHQARRPAAQHAHDPLHQPGEAGAEGARVPRDLRAARPPARHEHDQVGARGPRRSRRSIPRSTTRSSGWSPTARRAATSTCSGVIDHVYGDLRGAKIRATVTGRPKHYYSIYQKMIVRGRDFADIYDLVGIRVLVDSVRDCYAVLGSIHARWNPVPGRFKDYIAMPKFNMYQSLHTTVIGPEGKPVELQIRTFAMHRRAEYGVAAHWKYKEDGDAGGGSTARDQDRSGRRAGRERHGLAAPAARLAARDRGPRRVPREPALRPQVRRGLRLHAQGRRHRAAGRRDADRLRLRGAHRGRAPLHRRPGQRPAGAAGEHAGQRRPGRGVHLQGRRAPRRAATG